MGGGFQRIFGSNQEDKCSWCGNLIASCTCQQPFVNRGGRIHPPYPIDLLASMQRRINERLPLLRNGEISHSVCLP